MLLKCEKVVVVVVITVCGEGPATLILLFRNDRRNALLRHCRRPWEFPILVEELV